MFETFDAEHAGAEGNPHERLMREALILARRGAGKVHPNPMVGSVIARAGTVIARGWHEACGGPHAEVNAVKDALSSGFSDLSDAVLYVTLEPCCHQGRTPPCTSLIIASGIRTVVCGMTDPNPLVAGKGVESLKEAGIRVIVGILEKECRALNRAFIKYISTHRPFIILKSAMSLDGKIATAGGESRWISCEESRADAHRLRAECTAILTGIGTVLADDPLLTVRSPTGVAAETQCVRIIADTKLRIPEHSRIVATAKEIRTIVAVGANTIIGAKTIACADDSLKRKIAALEEAGIEILSVRENAGHLDLADLCDKLGMMEIDSILLEAGGTLAGSALSSGIVDRARLYIAPILIGGEHAMTAVAGEGARSLASAWRLENAETKKCGRDYVIEGDICSPV